MDIFIVMLYQLDQPQEASSLSSTTVFNAYMSREEAAAALIGLSDSMHGRNPDLTLTTEEVPDASRIISIGSKYVGEWFIAERTLHGSPLQALAQCAEEDACEC